MHTGLLQHVRVSTSTSSVMYGEVLLIKKCTKRSLCFCDCIISYYFKRWNDYSPQRHVFIELFSLSFLVSDLVSSMILMKFFPFTHSLILLNYSFFVMRFQFLSNLPCPEMQIWSSWNLLSTCALHVIPLITLIDIICIFSKERCKHRIFYGLKALYISVPRPTVDILWMEKLQ